MKSVKYLLVVLGLLCGRGLYAQGDVNLRLDSNFIGLPATVHMGDTYQLTIIIKNDSLSAFHGVISIGYNINGVVGLADSATHPFYYAYNQDTIVGRSEIVRTLVVQFTPPFIIGSSGVVIWPIVASSNNLHVLVSDSLSFVVPVLNPVGIDEITDRKLKVYMDGQQLIVQDKGEYLLRDVKLYDVTGNLLQAQQFSVSGVFDMNKYAAGVYLAQITFADNKQAVIKVVNTK